MAMAITKRTLRVGLTGGIGSGKSTLGHILVSLGASLIDADQIAREVTGPHGAAMESIRASFGNDYMDATGALDRARMRALVFTQPQARVQLESIVHPWVSHHSNLQAQQAIDGGCPLLVFDVPLLTESGRWAHRLDAVIVVDCSGTTQIERVMRRSGLSHEAVQGIMASQASRRARRAVADIVITNDADCTLDGLRALTLQTALLFGL